jgi:hypothetical protein
VEYLPGRKNKKPPTVKTITLTREGFTTGKLTNSDKWKLVDDKLYYAVANWKEVYGMSESWTEQEKELASLSVKFDHKNMFAGKVKDGTV